MSDYDISDDVLTSAPMDYLQDMDLVVPEAVAADNFVPEAATANPMLSVLIDPNLIDFATLPGFDLVWDSPMLIKDQDDITKRLF